MVAKLSLLTTEAVQAALAEFRQLGRDAFLAKYGFGAARKYFVRDPLTGDLCDSKAIAGAAFRFLGTSGSHLQANEFSGGEQSVETRLTRLGFEVVHTDELSLPTARTERPMPWSTIELQLVVADYLDMLVLDLNGQPYNKSQRRRRLMPLLNGRSDSSIEFKRRNISAVLEDLGVPALRGYLRASNLQADLIAEVERQLRTRDEIDDAARSAAERPTQVPDDFGFERMLTEAPTREHHVRESTPQYLRSPIRRDYFEREANNRKIGRAGEELVVRFEQWRLAALGLGQLADRVEHVSVTKGDGLGYDVLTFLPDGREKFVEVKTTAFSQTTPFFVSRNEEHFARDHAEDFALYRVFDFRAAPKIFELPGPITRHCHLDPVTYRASFQ